MILVMRKTASPETEVRNDGNRTIFRASRPDWVSAKGDWHPHVTSRANIPQEGQLADI